MPQLKAPSKEESALLPPFAELPEQAIHLPQTEAQFHAAHEALKRAEFLGFDTESKPLFNAGQHDSGPHLVQLATPQQAWLLQLHHPLALEITRDILGSPHILKLGFGLDNDRHSLPRRLQTELRNIEDLDRHFKRLGYGSSVGVRAAVALVLGQSFRKSKRTTTSNWAASQLTAAQRRYAANDAHAPAIIQAAWMSGERKRATGSTHTGRKPESH